MQQYKHSGQKYSTQAICNVNPIGYPNLQNDTVKYYKFEIIPHQVVFHDSNKS